MTNQSITPEVVAALAVLRRAPYTGSQIADAMSVLDDAGIFAAIDAAAECTCRAGLGGTVKAGRPMTESEIRTESTKDIPVVGWSMSGGRPHRGR